MIVNAYRERLEIAKYSYLAPLNEIHENDYNLNIPRYVNTFEEEEPVNITEVSATLKKLETRMQETDKELIALCKELNIDTPF
jgi:type I restriction enzyme M protein